ncbi:MAG: hypothetical protein AAF531_02465 [Actinomycetota bacterium]
MGFLDSVRSWFRAEAAEARDLGDRTKSRLEADLDRREAELNLTPEERMARIQEEIQDDTGFAAIQDRIENRVAGADAAADVADVDGAARAAAEEALDLPSEEVIPPEPPPAD